MLRFFFIILALSSAIRFVHTEEARQMKEPSGQMDQNLSLFINSFDAAWNAHNFQALASLWHTDGDLITPWGQWIVGMSQIEKFFEQEMNTPRGKTNIHQTIDATRSLTPYLISLDVTIRSNHPQSPVQHGVYLLTNVSGKWKILSARIFQFQPNL